MASITIGVLALQGAFAKHIQMLKTLDVIAKEVRYPADLEDCDALIIPGGESTTMMRQIHFIGFKQPLIAFSKKKPVFGTCAGLILISHEIILGTMIPFALIDVDVERNAFGRQIESFQCEIILNLSPAKPKYFPAVFIRAPRIRVVHSDVEVLAYYGNEPVLVRQKNHLGATFHPELTDDPSLHLYFINLVKKLKKSV